MFTPSQQPPVSVYRQHLTIVNCFFPCQSGHPQSLMEIWHSHRLVLVPATLFSVDIEWLHSAQFHHLISDEQQLKSTSFASCHVKAHGFCFRCAAYDGLPLVKLRSMLAAGEVAGKAIVRQYIKDSISVYLLPSFNALPYPLGSPIPISFPVIRK